MYVFKDKSSFLVKSCLILFDHMDCSTPGSPVLHYLPEFAQTHAYRAGDAILSGAALGIADIMDARPQTPLLTPQARSRDGIRPRNSDLFFPFLG